MDKINSGGARNFLEIKPVTRDGCLQIEPGLCDGPAGGKSLDCERRDHQTREDDRQNDSCGDASHQLGGALLREF
jgi:hypothetical protein